MKLRSKPKTIFKEETLAASSATPAKRVTTSTEQPGSTPTRRSQRAGRANGPLNGIQNGNTGVTTTSSAGCTDATEKNALELKALEDRVLLRGMESYGRDNIEYIRTTMLPVHGSETVKSLKQVQYRCQQLMLKKGTVNHVSNDGDRKRIKSTNIWKSWIAPDVVRKEVSTTGKNGVHGTDERTDETTTKKPNGNNNNGASTNSENRSRSGRISKPPVFLDV